MKAKVLVVDDEQDILDLVRYHLERLAGLELGAGDCAVKPFSPRELGERQDQWVYFVELALFHSRDPRTTRTPLKILSIFGWEQGTWRKLQGDEIVSGMRPSLEEEA